MIRRVSVLLLTVAVIFSITAVAQTNTLLTRHTRDAVVNGEAQLLGRLPATQTMRVNMVLALRHAPELENFLADVYDPTSPNYRHYLTPEQFTERFGASRADYDAVVEFAKANGFKIVGGSFEGRDVQLNGTVAQVETAFHVTMGLYQHPTENRQFFAPDREPSVDLPFQLWHISGLDNYELPHRNIVHKDVKQSPQITGSCPDDSYCASDMRAAYYGTGSLTGTGQNMALLELAGTTLSDLANYYKNAKQTEPYVPTLLSEDGYTTTCTDSCEDIEQSIDMQQEMGMAPGTTMLYNYVCGDAYNEGTFDETGCLAAMVSNSQAPLSLQISSSWSWKPADPSTDDPYYEQMAAQGQSFFDAAGDSGHWVSGGFAYPCEDDYVICVGGTELTTEGAGGPWESEVGWPDSGGGISIDGIPIPSWQQLAGVVTSKNRASKTLRNGPDVAAEANTNFYWCADGTCGTGEGGTSFAAPMWAGYMALANQQAVLNGAPAPGFIDPAIYPLGLSAGYAAAFHDITSGNNGFPAEPGYDLITGWGSPNGAGLINALTTPSGPSFSLSANPSSLSIAAGSQGTSTITVTPADGFSGSVTLSASGLPSGVTAGFNPNPTSTTSTLTLTVASGTASGTSTVTINGASGSLTASTTVQLTITSSGPIVSLNPTSLTWGKVVVGKTAGAKKVTVTNTGASTLNITNISTTGDFALFSFTSKLKCGSTLAAGKSCIVKVNFTPTQVGTRTGSLNFTDNAPGSPQSVALSGTGK
jgi:kumamolisin